MKITLKKGILGFENLKEYELLDIENEDVLKEFNSTEEDCIGFIVVSPFEIIKEYEIVLNQETIEESTVNMKAPIVINVRNNCGMQIILQDEKYSIWHPLLRGDGGC